MDDFLPDSHEGVERELVRNRGRNGWLSVIVFLLINNVRGYFDVFESIKINIG